MFKHHLLRGLAVLAAAMTFAAAPRVASAATTSLEFCSLCGDWDTCPDQTTLDHMCFEACDGSALGTCYISGECMPAYEFGVDCL